MATKEEWEKYWAEFGKRTNLSRDGLIRIDQIAPEKRKTALRERCELHLKWALEDGNKKGALKWKRRLKALEDK
jgi:hypothetical protein